ncbi:MAG TPA: hypothetical protein HA254_00975 [Candidatus Diapherotrites archaeon]|uniref:Uncharacterized protein n=1 Tax=Candidatus Iainarchaeum sp. TaxID=3101447 RepID=A0A7J4IUV9_9ARCH|nr:hypothetical protein [Candidatus Diapherotrites archaeon]
MYTTVRVSDETKGKLESLKEYKRESMDDVLNKLVALVPEGDGEGKYKSEFRAGLLEALYQSKTKKTVSFEKVKKEAGL